MSTVIKATKWITGNTNGKAVMASIAPTHVTDLLGQEQSNYGIVNCRVGGKDVQAGWCYSNFNGSEVKRQISGNPTKFLVREELNYGIVNFGVEDDGEAYWVTKNQNGNLKSVTIPRGSEFIGFQAREQDGFGIVDMRAFYIEKA
jgi:hypothetical protein